MSIKELLGRPRVPIHPWINGEQHQKRGVNIFTKSTTAQLLKTYELQLSFLALSLLIVAPLDYGLRAVEVFCTESLLPHLDFTGHGSGLCVALLLTLIAFKSLNYVHSQ